MSKCRARKEATILLENIDAPGTDSHVIQSHCRECSAWLTVFVKTQGPSSVGGRP